MRIEIYCDESRPDLFSSSNRHENPFLSIGGVWMPSDSRTGIKNAIKTLRQEYGIWSEFKWNKISSGALPFYLSLVDLFFNQTSLHFRTILVNSQEVNFEQYHQSDPELGFYKFYYQLLTHWMTPSNDYSIFADIKTNRMPDRLEVLRSFLERSNPQSKIINIQSLPSKEVGFIQLADLLTGAVNAKINGATTSANKNAIINRIEERMGRPIRETNRGTNKFNVFKIRLNGVLR